MRCDETGAGIFAMLKTESHDFRGHAADGLQRHAGVLHLAVSDRQEALIALRLVKRERRAVLTLNTAHPPCSPCTGLAPLGNRASRTYHAA